MSSRQLRGNGPLPGKHPFEGRGPFLIKPKTVLMSRWGLSAGSVGGRAASVALLGGVAILAAACGRGGGETRTPTPSATTQHAAQSADIVTGSVDVAVGPDGAPPVVGPNLPGITVVGAGETKGVPDRAILRLTVGSGNEFSGPEGVASKLIEERELEPVVQALKKAGAPGETITVNTYASSPYSGFGNAAQITLTWPQPREIDKAIEAAQGVIRAKTRFSLQNVEALFTTKSCVSLEDKAWRSAIADARKRATRLAALTGATTGPVIAVSEAPGASSGYLGSGSQGCQALRALPPSFLTPSLTEGTPDAVKVSVSLQVTFAFKSK